MGEDNMNGSHDEEMDAKLGERAANYVNELVREKHLMDPAQTGNAMRLLDDGISVNYVSYNYYHRTIKLLVSYA